MNGAALRDICVAAAEAGARVLRDLYDRPREVSFKGRIDLVTDADRAAEERVLSVLHERVPGARVLAEESGETGAASGERFIVDSSDDESEREMRAKEREYLRKLGLPDIAGG